MFLNGHLSEQAYRTLNYSVDMKIDAMRYRGEITVGTLRNWRAMRVGPAFVKIGKAVLYPVDQLDAWDEKNLVTCRASRRLSGLNSVAST